MDDDHEVEGLAEDGVDVPLSTDGQAPTQEVIGLLLQQNGGQVLTLTPDMVGNVDGGVTDMGGVTTVQISESQLHDSDLSTEHDEDQMCVGADADDQEHQDIDEHKPNHSLVEKSDGINQENQEALSEVGLLDGQIGQQIVTLPNGQQVQAVSVTLSEDGKMLEGQTIQLADGTTAIVQGLIQETPKVEPVPVAEPVPQVPRLVEGQAIQLEDGSIAYIQNTSKDGLQAIQLEDGTTAYISTSSADALFGNATIDGENLNLEALNQTNGMVTSTTAPQTTATTAATTERPLTLSFTDKSHRCSYEGCNRLYTTLHHLKVHERAHTGDRPFKCKYVGCGKAFSTGYGLKSHTRVHTGEKPYRCPEEVCNKAFKTSGDLQKHVRTHTGERPFKCPFEGCDRSFTTSNIRKVHIRTHTGERPYICEEDGCNKAFASATNYKNHIRIHTGEKPYVCTVEGCGKRFTEYSSLYKHHVVHTHTKPYVCNHCGKNYRQTSTLAMHKRTAHGDETAIDGDTSLLLQSSDLALATALPANGAVDAGMKRIQVQLPAGFQNPEVAMEDDEGALVINTSEAQQVTMLTDQSAVGGFTQEAAQATLQQLTTGQGIALADSDGQQHIYVVTDPAQLEALQQLAQQQLLAQVENVEDPNAVQNSPSKDAGAVVIAPSE